MCTCLQAAGSFALPVSAPGSWQRGLLGPLGLGGDRAPPRKDLALSGLTVVNPGVDRVADATIRLREGRIAAVEASGPPGEAEFAGCFALPGLIDMHVHGPPPLRDFFARLQLLHGVTSVRNTGDGPEIFSYRDEVEAGDRQGPRVFACGPPLDGKPTAFPLATLGLESPERARARVARLAEQGADFVKVFINLTPPMLAAIRDEAERHGLRVAGHVPRFNTLEDAGVQDVQHLTGVPEHPSTAFSLDGAFEPWVEAWLRLDARRRDRVIASSLGAGVAHTPTLVLWKGLARGRPGNGLAAPKGLALMPRPYVESFWRTRPPPTPYTKALGPSLFASIDRALPEMIAFVGELDAAGVRVLAGTDTINPWVVPGASLHEEIELLASAGMGPERALACATRDAAAGLGRDDLGRIRDGASADLVILDGDPTDDLTHLDSIRAVVAGGRLYRSEDLRRDHERARARLSSLPLRVAAPVFGRAVAAALRALPAPGLPSPPAT